MARRAVVRHTVVRRTVVRHTVVRRTAGLGLALFLVVVLAAGLIAGCSTASQTSAQEQASQAPASQAPASQAPASPAQATQSQPSQGQASPVGADATGDGAAVAVQQDFVSVIRQVMPSVVEIRTSAGLGSGVVLDADGDIVTNAHVVGGASSFQVLSSAVSAPLSAVLVGSCPADDLAVIKVGDASALRPAKFGDLDSVAVGDIVLAIGSPLGLGGSVTEGIVSAVGRSVTEPASTGEPSAVLTDVIQTSAAINPGNSGGALVGLNGEVIGIPTLAAVNRGGAAPGIGFAIPASTAVRIGGQLAADGQSGSWAAPAGCAR
jgi:putative serine protease PepD